MDNRDIAVDITGSASHGGHSRDHNFAGRDRVDTEPRPSKARSRRVRTSAPLLRGFLEPANPLMQSTKRSLSLVGLPFY